MNNQKIITPIIVILIVISFCVIGVLAWQYFETPKEKIKEFQEKIPERIVEAPKRLKISSDIALNDEKLTDFLIEHKIGKGEEVEDVRAGFINSQIIRRDLNKDGVDEIIIGFAFGGPSLGWIGLIGRIGEEYKVINWKEVGLAVSEMKLKNIPNDRYQSLVVKTAGGAGTGLFYREIFVYTYINNQLKLTFNEFIEEVQMAIFPKTENIYEISFKDVDYDGNIDIIQEGIEKEIKLDYEIPPKEAFVKNIFKWNEREKVFEKK